MIRVGVLPGTITGSSHNRVWGVVREVNRLVSPLTTIATRRQSRCSLIMSCLDRQTRGLGRERELGSLREEVS